MRVGQRRLLKTPIDEPHVPGVAELIARPRDQPFAGLDRRHPQAAGEQAACQLAGTTADLEHHCAGTETRHLAGPVDQRVRVGRPVTVIFLSDLVEDLAVATVLRCAWHVRKVDDDQDDPAAQGGTLAGSL